MQTISLNFVLLSLKIQAKQAMNHTNSIVKTTTLKSPKILLPLVLLLMFLTCHLDSNAQQEKAFSAKKVYKSKGLIITQITQNTFVHTSYKQTDEFGNVPCNGLIVRNGSETIIFDTPTTDKTSAVLIKWIQKKLHCTINAVIPTHFHDDCLGGLQAFDEQTIPSYANSKTVEYAKENKMVVPKNSFNDSLRLNVGNAYVTAIFFGEGHTKDNVVGYFPEDNVLFGGCLIKTMDAGKGYLGDANVAAWSATVEKVKQAYPQVKFVVPGHGPYGDQKLLDYTIQLFRNL
jgi:metallo-beta-lactamase class B